MAFGQRRARSVKRPAFEAADPTSVMGPLLTNAHIIVCCGAGGVGKTSTTAALALRAAQDGRRTCVLTIDPARRLAQALGLELLGNTPTPVRDPSLDDGNGGSRLDAMMLDMRRTFDDVVVRYSRSEDQAQRILTNRFYQQMASTLSGTQEYMAMEKLYELHEQGDYDLLVVDTPPTRSALDFLDAPRNLTDLLDGRLLRLLLGPSQRLGRGYLRGIGMATTAAFKMASRITGSGLMGEVADFFAAFEGMYEGFKQRARRVYEQLGEPDTAFVVLATPDHVALQEAAFFTERLVQESMPLGAVVVNRATAAAGAPIAAAARRRLQDRAAHDEAAAELLFLLDQQDRRRERRAIEQQRVETMLLSSIGTAAVLEVPRLDDEVHDLRGLQRLAVPLVGPATFKDNTP